MEIITKSPDETKVAGANFAKNLKDGDIVTLKGDLGSGKTCFITGASISLGVDDIVNSPTYSIINIYSGKKPIVHMDAYRLKSEDEAWGIGFEDYLDGKNICFIEWPEKISAIIPENSINLNFEVLDENSRKISW